MDDQGNEVKISSGDILLLEDERYTIESTNVSSTLLISSMTKTDARQYRCYRGERGTSYVTFSRSHPAMISHSLHIWGRKSECSLQYTNLIPRAHPMG